MSEIYCIGDSITQGVWDAQGGWADRIKQHFHQKKLENISISGTMVFNWGISGDNTGDIINRLPHLVASRYKDGSPRDAIFIFAAGVNDSLARDDRQNVIFSPSEYRANL